MEFSEIAPLPPPAPPPTPAREAPGNQSWKSNFLALAAGNGIDIDASLASLGTLVLTGADMFATPLDGSDGESVLEFAVPGSVALSGQAVGTEIWMRLHSPDANGNPLAVYIDNLTVTTPISSGSGVAVTRFDYKPDTNELTISWESQPGKLYNVRSVLDPSSAEPVDWPLFDPHEDIAATPPENTLVIPKPADAKRFFVIEEFNAPPVKVYTEDFETGGAGWTPSSEGVGATRWELGTPDAGLLNGPPAANNGSNCYGTDLDANYVEDTLIRLQSPPIDLSGIVGGTITYWRWRDIELTFDSATVRLLDAADGSLIRVLAGAFDGTSTAWEEITHNIPAAAVGKSVILEFVFESDSIGNQAGFYVDDICVQGPAL